MGEIAHIRSPSSDGPRFDPSYDDELLNSFENLLVLCPTHHRLVDFVQVEQHPTERLMEIKRARESVKEKYVPWADQATLAELADAVVESDRDKQTLLQMERRLHGERSLLLGSLLHLEMANEQLSQGDNGNLTAAQSALQDGISFLEEIRHQKTLADFVTRIHRGGAIDIGRVGVAEEVLPRILTTGRRMVSARDLGIEIVLHPGVGILRGIPPVAVNSHAVTAAIHEVLDNALRYSRPEKSQVLITCSEEPDEDAVVIDIWNTGISIGADELGMIFEPGFRGVQAMAVSPVGLGNGLSDSRDIMRAMGGDVTYAGIVDGATVFRTAIPTWIGPGR